MDKETKKKYNKRYYQNNKQILKVERKGLAVEEYDRLFESQGFSCAVCGTRTNGQCGRDFEVDFGSDGMVRGLLCSRCKAGIDNLSRTELLEKAIKYLGESNGESR